MSRVFELPTVKDIIRNFKTLDQEECIAVAVWSEIDVMNRAKERNIEITKEEARQIIEVIHRRQDSTLGITWDTIDCYLDEVKK